MVFEPVSKRHNRSAFDCGVESVNRYLRESARQQADRRLTLTTVLVESPGDSEVIGFHTLVMSTVLCAYIPAKGLPSQQQAPVVLLAQFGVSLKCQGRGIGKRLLYDALARALLASNQVGCMGVVLNAVDENAREFYLARGFSEMTDDPFHLWMPMSMVEDLFASQSNESQDR
jgi:GNAT superfamily N-acetyltransferase